MKKTAKIKPTEALARKIHAVLREIVILRDRGCITPSPACAGPLQCGHFFSATDRAVRFDLRNVACQCAACNQRHNYHRAPYTEWMITVHGAPTILDLSRKAQETKKWTVEELENILAAVSALRDALAEWRREHPDDPAPRWAYGYGHEHD